MSNMHLMLRLRSMSYVGVFCLLISTILLVIFIRQTSFELSQKYYSTGFHEDNTGEKLAPLRALRNQFDKSGNSRTLSDEAALEDVHLNAVSHPQAGGSPGVEVLLPAAPGAAPKSNYTEQSVHDMINKLTKENENFVVVKNKEPYLQFLRNYRRHEKRKGFGLPAYKNYKGYSNWEKFHMGIDQYALYDPSDPAIPGLLHDLAKLPIVDVEQMTGGTQLKLIFKFSDEGHALFKPMRFSRETETLENHFYFTDYERHTAEIAAFHLDRLLAFYRVPPTAGRVVNMTHDIKRLATHKLAKTFFTSPANNVCFHGTCFYYCNTPHAICGKPDIVEGSFGAFLPPSKIASRQTWRNPWKRYFGTHGKAYWEMHDDLCEKIRYKPPYDNSRRLLDIMDMHIFDFLTGNMDRHHYETITVFGNNTFLLHFDNGKGFGRTMYDEMSILAPIKQCCLIRHSTFVKLGKLYSGPDKLSDVIKESLSEDDVAPILTDLHLSALDRRVTKILVVISNCLKTKSYNDVIVDDHL